MGSDLLVENCALMIKQRAADLEASTAKPKAYTTAKKKEPKTNPTTPVVRPAPPEPTHGEIQKNVPPPVSQYKFTADVSSFAKILERKRRAFGLGPNEP